MASFNLPDNYEVTEYTGYYNDLSELLSNAQRVAIARHIERDQRWIDYMMPIIVGSCYDIIDSILVRSIKSRRWQSIPRSMRVDLYTIIHTL